MRFNPALAKPTRLFLVVALVLGALAGQVLTRPVHADQGPKESHDPRLSEHFETASHDAFLSEHEEQVSHDPSVSVHFDTGSHSSFSSTHDEVGSHDPSVSTHFEAAISSP